MDTETIVLLLGLLLSLFALVAAFSIGTLVERRHYLSIRRREAELRGILLIPIRTSPRSMLASDTALVSGSVVIGMDYFKRMLASLRNLVGGQMGAYESLLERARREAILRMKETARDLGATPILNIKFATADIMSGNRENKGSGCVEVYAYGTALIPRK